MAVLFLMHDLLDIPLLPEGDSYSLYSLGIMLGILAVALNLAVAVMAAVNAALASHLSLQPEQKAPNIEGRLIFCMVMLFSTAIVSGFSLTLLSINIDPFFTICVGVLFFFGVAISIHHVWVLFGFNWRKYMDQPRPPLSTLSLILSSLTFMLAVAPPDTTVWFTIPIYYLILTYHLLVDIRNMPYRPGRRSIDWTFTLCLLWTASSILTIVFKLADPSSALWYKITFGTLSSSEAITLATIGIVGSRKRRSWMRQRQLQMNLAEA